MFDQPERDGRRHPLRAPISLPRMDFSGCMIPTMASAGRQSDLNIQLLIDSIPALIHTATPRGLSRLTSISPGWITLASL